MPESHRPAPADLDTVALAVRLPALAPWITAQGSLAEHPHGERQRWLDALDTLPALSADTVTLDAAVVGADRGQPLDDDLRAQLVGALRSLMPWRKGPFSLFGVDIDTEWRSDLKWARLADAIAPLAGRAVLDVGCGSGYHAWRMAGAGAATVLGLEPMLLYVVQFLALRRYLGDHRAWVLPARLEQLPADRHAFDTVFSMGVLYHQRSPFDHLRQLRGALRAGGQLVLETLVVEGGDDTVLVPAGRYARMGNTWFLPSTAALVRWLARMKFSAIEVVDVSVTTQAEQRATDWMPFESLADALDLHDPSRTVEGYPAPRRAIVIATA